MVRKNDTQSHKKLIIGTVLIVGLIGLFVIIFLLVRPSSDTSGAINYDPPSKAEQSAGEQTKLDQTSKTDVAPSTGSTDTIGRLEISSLSQDSSNKTIVIQTKLYDTTWKSCTVTLTKKTLTVSKTSDVLFSPDFSTCMGFAFDSNELSEGGVWSVTLTAKQSNGKIATAPPKTISVVK